MVLANDGITLAIPDTCFLRNDVCSLINADTVTEGAAPFLLAQQSLTVRFLASSVLVQLSAILFVGIDVQVNYFRTDLQFPFQLKSIGDLFRANSIYI